MAAVSKSSKTRIDASAIVEAEFGRYRIKAGRLTGNFVARAFLKGRSNGHGMMAEASGGSEDEAIAALKSLLSDREDQRTEARRWEQRSNISVPSQEEFVEALQQTNLTENQLCSKVRPIVTAPVDRPLIPARRDIFYLGPVADECIARDQVSI